MTEQAGTPPMLEITPATIEQQSILSNLLQLYAHDFSEFHAVDLGPDGRFVYSSLPLYWSDPDRHPFLVSANDRLAGFVLVKKGSEVSDNERVWDIAEFFVIRGCRRRGLGTRIAREIWSRFPGSWEVRVMHSNVSAVHFWRRAISAFTGGDVRPSVVVKDGERWNLFCFESKSGA
jgi:predicted acetyltransferase